MTINEALIKSEYGMTYTDEEHDQIIEWLKELKAIRTWKADIIDNFCKHDASSFEELIAKGYNKAIDDFANYVKVEILPMFETEEVHDVAMKTINEIAEELKS